LPFLVRTNLQVIYDQTGFFSRAKPEKVLLSSGASETLYCPFGYTDSKIQHLSEIS
jgi:hypothetical protein